MSSWELYEVTLAIDASGKYFGLNICIKNVIFYFSFNAAPGAKKQKDVFCKKINQRSRRHLKTTSEIIWFQVSNVFSNTELYLLWMFLQWAYLFFRSQAMSVIVLSGVFFSLIKHLMKWESNKTNIWKVICCVGYSWLFFVSLQIFGCISAFQQCFLIFFFPGTFVL